MTNCIFCKIAEKEESASVVYEDNDFIALMDTFPLSEGHCLVIPKNHVTRLDELRAKERSRLFNIGHKVIKAQKKIGYGVQGTNILINDGKAANQTVPHLHLHLIPRESGDLIRSIPKLILHISGIFGFKTSRSKLDQQAIDIASHL